MSFWYRRDVCSSNRPLQKHHRLKARHGFGALLLVCTPGAVVQAQDALPPGVTANLSITQRLEYSDNPGLRIDDNAESDFFGRTLLNFGLLSVNKIERLRFNIGTEIEEFSEDNGQDLDFTNSFVSLGYNRATDNASLGLDLQYREADVDSTFIDDDFLEDGSVLRQDNGTRQSYTYQVNGAIGRQAPIGATFSARLRGISYDDTDDDSLRDRDIQTYNARVNFRVDPRITASLIGRYNDFDSDGGVDRETTSLGVGLNLDFNQTLSGNFSLTHDRIERSGSGSGSDSGLSLRANLNQDLTNGSMGLSFVSDVESNDNGRRSTLRFRRQIDFARDASLNVALGLTGAGDVIGTDPLIDVDYRKFLRDGQINLSMSQAVVTDTNNDEEINTRIRAGYEKQINNLSSLGASIALFNRNELDNDGDDDRRIDLNLTYNYDLTRDWGLVSGYRYTISEEDGTQDRTSNTVFVGLRRNFDWNP